MNDESPDVSEISHATRARNKSRVSWVLFILVVVASGLWLRPMLAQEASRYALTAAIAESGTVQIDDYEQILSLDRAVHGGNTYSDKAPGQPVLAVPFYLAYRWAGGESAVVERFHGNLGLWFVTLFSSAVPLGILAVLMYRFVLPMAPRWALFASLATVFGTILFPLATLLFGHVLAACLVFAAYYVLERRSVTQTNGLLMGVLLGAAVVVEYTAAIAAVAIAVLALWLRGRWALWIVPGAAVMASLLGMYNAAAFGDPWTLSYSYSAFTEVTESARGTFNIFSSFGLDNLAAVFLRPRGFLIASPIVLVGLAGSIALTRRPETKRLGVVPVILFTLYLLIPVFWGNPWGGASPGPRYMVTCLPFLAVGVVQMASRRTMLTWGATALSVLTMSAAVVTEPRLLPEVIGGLGGWLSLIGEGRFAPTVFTSGSFLGPVIVAAGCTAAGWRLWKNASRNNGSLDVRKPVGPGLP